MVYVGGFPPEFPFRFPMINLPACAYAIGCRLQPIFPRQPLGRAERQHTYAVHAPIVREACRSAVAARDPRMRPGGSRRVG